MSIQPFSRTNPRSAIAPKTSAAFAVDQRYEEYTPVDHAVWRFIMRQNIFFLKEYAHKVLFSGAARYPAFPSNAFRGSKR